MLIRTIFRCITIGSLLVFISCQKDAQTEGTVHTDGVRLKHITKGSDVESLLRPLMQDYTLDHEAFTDVGSYPSPSYRYYYDINWDWNLGNDRVTAYRSLSCSAGMGDESKEEILESAKDFVEIQDERLGKAPYNNVFAIRYTDQKKSDWRCEMYILKVGNHMRNQSITLSGSYGPIYRDDIEALAPSPPDNKMVVTELLKLLEPID
ncbi:hypothetical protein ACS126_03605 [Sphingobacterium lactis]|uniref:hypothetical protein n=1 Tax=Sphingobacterium TaxID=28453 RepID=UPI0021A6C6D4|nr:hypothetical protein [Sphingobacterium hotanense]MCT1526067.1 hypothetical protein [Sphingobacterium hotanense]